MSLSPQIPNHAGTEPGCLSYQLMPLDLQNQQQVPLQAASPPALEGTLSPVRDISKRVQRMAGPSGRAGVLPPSTPVSADALLRATVSPQMLALGELEFHRVFPHPCVPRKVSP